MTDNLTLYCLVDGEPMKDAFKIRDIPPSHDVDDLKDAIVRKKPNDFRDGDANKLTLCRVSIHDDGTIHDKTELNNPRAVLSTLFAASPDDNTYIIVQRPAPVPAPIPTRISTCLSGHLSDECLHGTPMSATPIPKRYIPYDSLEKELALIIKDASQLHVWHTVDATNVETAQKERLGPFYKNALPYGTTASTMKEAMLGMVLDKESTSSDNKTLREIVESDIGKTTNLSVLLLTNDAQLTPEQFFREQIIGGAVTIGTLVNMLRGFLTPLRATLGNVRATLVVLGTSLSLQGEDNVYPAVGMRTRFHSIMRFPLFDDQDVEHVLSKLIDTSGCTIPHDKLRKLTGRAQFSVSVIRELFKLNHTNPHTKQARLEKAFDSAINLVSIQLRGRVRELLGGDTTGEVVHLLGRMVLAFKLQGGKVWFARKAQVKFMDNALCALRVHSGSVHWLMDESLVVEVVEEELEHSNVDLGFSAQLRQLNGIIEHFGVKSSAKGNALEPLVRQSLRRFNNWHLADLPFLQGIELPAWCSGQKLQIDEINTAHGFGYGADNTEADLNFLINRPSNKLLVQQSGTRQDAAWFFSDNRYAGSLAIKIYGNDIPQTDHQKNETSSDIRCSFLRADGVRMNPSLERIRDAFVASVVPNKIKGILRIHLELPRVQGVQLATHVKRDPATGTEDVMVHIDLSNIDDFFYEGIEEKKEDILYLKKLIKYVLAK
ncbi:hypothetical protein KI688_003848 [Linnemannia hyalina]|uniref:Crinkler effector protein N-terminal domain-containing protein n=1 Tax=Linnemannia hyalina TaxID=64524 RepID=A0A9P7XQ96_9FUNG|nr:hypothetical protein KI688_003848 [Linnemannia hyalina]